jgi:hypothetical protein
MELSMSAKDLVKFGILVGLCAIFIDASIAHGLFWDNDPYWTYWITKSFLIATVFIVGTALIGVGLVRGAIITAVHTLILEIYYQWLAPVGLPQEPEWLDFNHLWVTGIPAHFLAIYAGYLLALWLWRRNRDADPMPSADTRGFVYYSLAASVLALLLDGVLTQGLLLQNFPGLTFFVQHLLIGFVFVAAWTAAAGLSTSATLLGALMLALVWTTYSMYLGPRGLPAHIVYSGYADLWLRSFPGAFLSAAIALWAARSLLRRRLMPSASLASLLICFAVLAPPRAEASDLWNRQGIRASADASGMAMRVVGPNPVDLRRTQPAEGQIHVETLDAGNRWSHVQNLDHVHVSATFTSGGHRYAVNVDKAMPRHPFGRYTTWSGVTYSHEMHGSTGIGTSALPRMRPDIALWGWGEVQRDGQTLSRLAPVHLMVTRTGPMRGVMLEVDTEDKALVGEPDGYLTVMWPNIRSASAPDEDKPIRELIGWIVLGGITLLFGFLAARARAAGVP